MAHQEACQLFIEQEIQERLAQGKTPSSIGKELKDMVAKIFEASIPAETLRSRARYMKKGRGEITAPPTTTINHSEIQNKRPNQPLRGDDGQFVKGKPPGPGAPPKYQEPKQEQKPPHLGPASALKLKYSSSSLYFARLAISQQERIPKDDQDRREAFDMVIHWMTENP